MSRWETEQHGDLTVRVRYTKSGEWLAECRHGDFETDSAVTEPSDVLVWFGWAVTREQAIVERLSEAGATH